MMTYPGTILTDTVLPHTGPAVRREAQPFTIDGSAALEDWMARICEAVAEGVSAMVPTSRLEAILLGGGYGRGEGGVLKSPAGDLPYNDIEFYVFIRGDRRLNEYRFGNQLRAFSEHLSSDAGIEVELKILSLAALRRSPPSMFYYDLIVGHRWIAGFEELLAGTEHHYCAGDIPLHEATRLLMNRCSGLLFARERLEGEEWTAQHADFVARNIAKAQLAFGDAVLTVYGRYHWSCRERNRRLHALGFEMPAFDVIRAYHDDAVAFKLHPAYSTDARELLRYRHEEVTRHALEVFLWIEKRRLHQSFADARSYALSSVNKCPETNPARNVLVNVKALASGLLCKNPTRHPRERILNALALLLWTPAITGSTLNRHLQKWLNCRGTTFEDFLAAYKRLWCKFN